MKWKLKIRSWIPPGIPKWSAIVTTVLLAIAWSVPPWRLAPMFSHGETIPLHYNVYFGVDYVGSWQFVLVLPAFATVVFFLNSILSVRERRESKLLSNILAITHTVVAFFVVLALFFVMLVNV